MLCLYNNMKHILLQMRCYIYLYVCAKVFVIFQFHDNLGGISLITHYHIVITNPSLSPYMYLYMVL